MDRPDPRRIVLIVLAVLVGAALLASRLAQPAPEPAPRAMPAFDAAEVAVRRTLQDMPRLGGPLEDPKLLEKCEPGYPDTWRVLESPELDWTEPVGNERTLQLTAQGNGARMEYAERLRLVIDAPSARGTAILDGPARDAWVASLHAGGYPTAWPPTADWLCSHSGWVAIESCVDGRYFATLRSCQVTSMHAFVGRLLDDARKRTRTGAYRK